MIIGHLFDSEPEFFLQIAILLIQVTSGIDIDEDSFAESSVCID